LERSPSVAEHSRGAAAGHSPSVAEHSRGAAAERSRVAVVRLRVAGADFPVVGATLPAAADEFRVVGERSLDESDSAREKKSVDDHFAD
jgi:hypothetical protein